MHYERTSLPEDVHEVFFSDVYYYASSAVRTAQGRPKFVGCGATREEAFSDLRREAARAEQKAVRRLQASTPIVATAGELVLLSEEQRQVLARNLVCLRQGRKVAQLHVARQALGFTKSHATVSRLERAELRQVLLAHLERLAAFYATTIDALLRTEPIELSAISANSTVRRH